MGVFTHDPIEAKNSPGFLFIIKLAELLKEEGFKYLDLTPGGDLYKEEFSNMRQKLYRPTFYFNKKENFLFQFENLIKNIVKKLISQFFKPENILKIKIQPFGTYNYLERI